MVRYRPRPTNTSLLRHRQEVPILSPFTKQTTLTMLGSLGFNPISANGFKPAMSPKPIGPFSCVSGSCGFWPACIVGSACGVVFAALPPGAAAARAAPLTMWMVCDVWILYVESASSSFSTLPVPGAGGGEPRRHAGARGGWDESGR